MPLPANVLPDPPVPRPASPFALRRMAGVYTPTRGREIISEVIELCRRPGHDDRARHLYAWGRTTQELTLREEGMTEAADIDPRQIARLHEGTLGALLGIEFVEASRDRLVAELRVRDDLRTVGGALHGGTLMAFADTVGATATALNLPAGAGTTTLESKTNFFAAGRSGIVRAESTPLHRGRRTMVWQTRITDDSGRLLSLTIQTQMVLT